MLFSKIIKKKFDAVLGRYEEDPAMFFYSVTDFKGLNRTAMNITADHQIELQGAFYYYHEIDPDKLVVFDHGIGSGHRAYLKEINMLAREGYTVYSYDHTGCADTGGKGIMGFAQGVNDLDHVLTVLKQDERFKGKNIRLAGHSWGGYSCMNVAQFHPEVTHVVSLAGFLSAKALVEQYLPSFVMKYSGEVMDREREINPRYADLDATESLLKTKAKVFHIQSTDDEMVKYDLCYRPLEKALKNRDNTVLVTLENHGHEPQLSEEAAHAVEAMSKQLKKLNSRNKLNTEAERENFRKSYDWDRLSEQDERTWNMVFDFLRD